MSFISDLPIHDSFTNIPSYIKKKELFPHLQLASLFLQYVISRISQLTLEKTRLKQITIVILCYQELEIREVN